MNRLDQGVLLLAVGLTILLILLRISGAWQE